MFQISDQMNFSLLLLMVLNWNFTGFHALLTPLNDDLMRFYVLLWNLHPCSVAAWCLLQVTRHFVANFDYYKIVHDKNRTSFVPNGFFNHFSKICKIIPNHETTYEIVNEPIS